MPAKIQRYGLAWPEDTDPLTMELYCVAHGGQWKEMGQTIGLGTFEHLMNARSMIWPNRYRHRWTELLYREFIRNDVTILMGAASAQKTSHAVEYALLNYWARPEKTLVILSTTSNDKLDIGVYAELSMLWKDGQDRHPDLAGNLLAHKRAITTQNLELDDMRDFRKGIICRPCYVGGKWVGLGILAGVKQDFIFYVADELQFMEATFGASWPHLFSNGEVKIIGSGNPKHDPEDELSRAAEPKDGWGAHPEPNKTEVWDTKFMGGRCVNLVGTDSPNFDVPEGGVEPFKGLIGRKFARRIEHDHGPDSFEYYRLVKGVMKMGFALSRVITRQICREHHALEKAVWKDTNQQRVYFLDPSYGGEDRCVGGCLEWGIGIDETVIIRVVHYRVYKFNLSIGKEIEDQIADILYEELKTYGIASTDAFYDSTGKGTLAGPFAIKFGSQAPVAIDSGAQPTRRPVRDDLFVDGENGRPRLKMCFEHYSKFVSEMWFSVRYAILANQLRELPDEMMAEGCARIYNVVAGNRIEVEPKNDPKNKENLKRRLGKSPDLFDALCIGMEGARRRGFQIAKLGAKSDAPPGDEWLEDMANKNFRLVKSKQLVH